MLLFYFFARDDAAVAAGVTIDSVLKLLEESKLDRSIVCYVGIDAFGRVLKGKGELYPSGDWRMYRIQYDSRADSEFPFEVKWLSKSDSPQDLATGVNQFLDLADKDLGDPGEPRTIVLSVSSHGIPAFGLSSKQFSQVETHIANQPEDVIRKQWAEIVKAISASGEFEGDQKHPALAMLQEIGLDGFVDIKMPDSKIKNDLGLLERCFSFPSDFQKIGVGVMACLPIQERVGLIQSIQREGGENANSKGESNPAPTWESLSIRHFTSILKKKFIRNRLDLIFLHNCSLGMLETFYELRDAADHVIAANTTIAGSLIPGGWFHGIPRSLDVRQWCELIVDFERVSAGNSRNFIGVRNDDRSVWREVLDRIKVYVDRKRQLLQCVGFRELRNSCTSDEPATVEVEQLKNALNGCVANSALVDVTRMLLVQDQPSSESILPSIYLPTCGRLPDDSYRKPIDVDDIDGFSFLDEVAWDSVVRLPVE